MAMARRRVAEFAGEHFETIRNWERKLQGEEGYRSLVLRWQIQGAVAGGATLADTTRRLRIDPEDEYFASLTWDFYVKDPLRWDDAYLAKLGQDYQRALKEQKQLAQRRRR
jgi:hypothetical protein